MLTITVFLATGSTFEFQFKNEELAMEAVGKITMLGFAAKGANGASIVVPPSQINKVETIGFDMTSILPVFNLECDVADEELML